MNKPRSPYPCARPIIGTRGSAEIHAAASALKAPSRRHPRVRALLVTLCLVLLTMANLTAASQTITVRTLALGTLEMPDLFLKGEKDYLPLRFSARQPGVPVLAVAANPLPLHLAQTDEDGLVTYAEARRIPIPPGTRSILLLGWMAGDELRFVAIHDDFRAARANDWLLINTSSRPVAFSLGEGGDPVLVRPGESTTRRFPVRPGEGAAVLARAPFDGESKMFLSTYWPVHTDRRSVVLFFDDDRLIRAKRISDQPPPDDAVEGSQ